MSTTTSAVRIVVYLRAMDFIYLLLATDSSLNGFDTLSQH